MLKHRHYIHAVLFAIVVVCGAFWFADIAHAQANPPSTVPHGTCTTDPTFRTASPGVGSGIISTIVTNIKNILNAISGALFTHIISQGGFSESVRLMATLYIMFYGIMFTVGMVQVTVYDFTIRMIKIGLIATLMSPSAWGLFNITVVQFFNDGTDQFINNISGAVLGIPIPQAAGPFYVIDAALTKMVSAKTAVTLMAMFFTPPYGPVFGMLLVLGLGTFMKAILNAATTYLMSLIIKALLFGLAPIFLSFILFARTRYLFDGWLNQVVNATLQPIMLFTFLGFFVTLIGVAIDNILAAPVCWTEWSESVRGSPFSVHYWRFALCDGNGCQPYAGKWSANGPQSASGDYPIFPIDILGILVLVLLADLCARFNGVVTSIASDLAGASTQLSSMVGDIGGWFQGNKGGGKGGRAPSRGPFNAPNENVQQARAGAGAGSGVRPPVGRPTPPPSTPGGGGRVLPPTGGGSEGTPV